MPSLEIHERAWKTLEPELAQQGYELVEVEVAGGSGRSILRVFIDKEKGITLDDCAAVSQFLGPLLDKEELISGSYVLEVSSPGFDRPVRKPADFGRFAGERIKVKTHLPVEGRKRFAGTLRGFENGAVLVESEGILHRIQIENVHKANLVR
ncbi:MAG: ribosome maturation factor RimP [Candidatus Hydrogenedentes bacterium]|nr:ribosome maturation factor RimP [Candidatus Hydrogenedentota bacterium]